MMELKTVRNQTQTTANNRMKRTAHDELESSHNGAQQLQIQIIKLTQLTQQY